MREWLLCFFVLIHGQGIRKKMVCRFGGYLDSVLKDKPISKEIFCANPEIYSELFRVFFVAILNVFGLFFYCNSIQIETAAKGLFKYFLYFLFRYYFNVAKTLLLFKSLRQYSQVYIAKNIYNLGFRVFL